MPGNLTDVLNATNGTGGPLEPSGWVEWILGLLKWGLDIFLRTVGISMDIMNTNPIMGFIIILILVVLIFWIGYWVTMASTQGMRIFLIIGLIIIVLFVISFLWTQYGLPNMFSGLISKAIGVGGNASIGVENATNITIPEPSEGINFWK
jgi:amino acid transporter